jgi:hypothetical protein
VTGMLLLGPGVLPALLAMQIVWYLTWVPGSEQGMVTGLAIAVAAAQAPSRTSRDRPTAATRRHQLSPARNGRR